jgi:flagellar biosynthesis/type III secretory pathway protein FliH
MAFKNSIIGGNASNNDRNYDIFKQQDMNNEEILRLSEKDAEIQRLDQILKESTEHFIRQEKEIQRLKEEAENTGREKFAEGYAAACVTLNELIQEQAKQIQQLKEEVETAKSDYKYLHDRYCHYYDKCGQLESELSAAKEKHSQTWDAALESLGTIHKRRNGDKFMPKEQAKFIASLMEKDLEEAKSTYLNNLFENKKDSK